MDALRQLVRALRLSAARAQKAYGVSSAQLFVLEQLALHPALSLGELAEATATDPSSVSVVVARLSKRGLVARGVSEGDGRKAELRLSSRGRRLLRKMPATPQSRLVEALRRLPRRQLTALLAGMNALVHAIGGAGDEPEMFFEREGRRERP